jgi:hypothetical protein
VRERGEVGWPSHAGLPPFGEGVGLAGQILEVRSIEFLEQRPAGDPETADRPLLVDVLITNSELTKVGSAA